MDAVRSDCAINALFYNLHTIPVEGFISLSLQDISSGIMPTPQPPKETSVDDPLSVLRLVCFASAGSCGDGRALISFVPAVTSDTP